MKNIEERIQALEESKNALEVRIQGQKRTLLILGIALLLNTLVGLFCAFNYIKVIGAINKITDLSELLILRINLIK